MVPTVSGSVRTGPLQSTAAAGMDRASSRVDEEAFKNCRAYALKLRRSAAPRRECRASDDFRHHWPGDHHELSRFEVESGS